MVRKIVHIDMDAFYASVELREKPHLKGQPVVVAWDSARSVICAASYEARKYGLRSAMSVAKAKQLCPQAVYLPPNFTLYREVSSQVRAIYEQYTDKIEPLSLDEAYLDVTENFRHLKTATEVAQAIRRDIYERTHLTASAGVAPNKFLAKIASDWNKPNGIFVIKPHQVQAFLAPLPLGKIPGVGRVTQEKLAQLGLKTVGDLGQKSLYFLEFHFGKYGRRLFELAQGLDNREVQAHQEVQQISTETTFNQDLRLNELPAYLPDLAQKLMRQARQKRLKAKTVTLKLKTAKFKTITRSKTFSSYVNSPEDLCQTAIELMAKVISSQSMRFRLLGIGLSHLEQDEHAVQITLFDE